MKKILTWVVATTLLLASFMVLRTLAFTPPTSAKVAEHSVTVDAQRVAKNLSKAIQFRTVSAQLKTKPEHDQFEAFINWLAATYPEVHAHLQPQRLGQYSLLFTWPGTQPTLPSALLSSHYDVVPVIPGSEKLWTHPPYSGVIDQTHIWGRGALDDKSAVIALMEATSLLLHEGFQPERTMYLSLTHDEEIGGVQGTASIVKQLKNNGTHLAWTLDEGAFLLQGFFPGIEQPVASINVAEKGSMSVNLIAHGQGGHSSMPPRETAVGVLAAALLNLQEAPLPGTLEGESGGMIDTIARHMPFSQRLLFANRWLFGGLIDATLAKNPATDATLRTTTAPTMLSASVKQNVLAIEAVATVNFRLHPRDSIESVTEHIHTAVDDARVDVELLGGRAASRVSSSKSAGFQVIANAAKSTYGQIIIAPGLTIAGTDSRRYEAIAENSYRFNPMVVTPKDTAGFHGTNERISIDNMVKATSFYNQLIREGSRG